ncbi:hypothetical protein EMIT0196MI5_40089 [Pseudomonas sp. IT-196MI5]
MSIFAPEWGFTIQILHHQEYRYREQARSHKGSVLNRDLWPPQIPVGASLLAMKSPRRH